MKIHEYQARELFQQYGIPVTESKLFQTVDGVEEYAISLKQATVVKAQIHAGGRGKGGGVKFSPTPKDAVENAKKILGMNLITHQTAPEGVLVRKIIVAAGIDIKHEYYLAIVVDRATQSPFVIASTEGGVDIEAVAENNPEKIIKVQIDSAVGVWPYIGRKIANELGLEGKVAGQVAKTVCDLYRMFMDTDCSIAEINPLALTNDKQIFAIDGKVNFDSNALYRQKKIVTLRDFDEEDKLEIEASKHNLNYIRLDGSVGCMVNGAGLAMATMDTIKLYGAMPANFLDVGGTASTQRVEEAFKILLRDSNVKGILINIFGGIVRCDLVAQGVIEAISNLDGIDLPIVIRLSGTKSNEGKELLDKSGLNFKLANSLNEAAEKIVNAVKKG